jgi:hypothetical protein
MKNLTQREKSILAGLFLSKFDNDGLRFLGFDGFSAAFNVIGFALGVRPASIKNYRDEFDPLFPNNRKGWHKRPIREHCKDLYDIFGVLEIESFAKLLRQIIYKEQDLDGLIEGVEMPEMENGGVFAKRLLTGLSAERYFIDELNNIPVFSGLEVKDTTKLGCGFDFKLFSNDVSYAVEVKGLNDIHGSISLTSKEHSVASMMKDRYYLFVVKNFREKPFHELYQNPLAACRP